MSQNTDLVRKSFKVWESPSKFEEVLQSLRGPVNISLNHYSALVRVPTVSLSGPRLQTLIGIWRPVNIQLLTLMLNCGTGCVWALCVYNLDLSEYYFFLETFCFLSFQTWRPISATMNVNTLHSLCLSFVRFTTWQDSRCFLPATTKLWHVLPARLLNSNSFRSLKMVTISFFLLDSHR